MNAEVATGWPGVFRPLRHHVPDGARRLSLNGESVYFAVCGSPCWLPTELAVQLPWCCHCWSARRSL